MDFIALDDTRWTAFDGGPARAQALLTLDQWRDLREQWPAHLGTAVVLPNTADIAGVAGDLPRWSLVVLDFPKWTDGRAYSQARLLRSRHRYAGEVRATGEVLVDMVPLLERTGFDAAVLRGDQSPEAAERARGFFGAYYQGDVGDPRPLFARDPDERRPASAPFTDSGAAI